MGQQQQQNGAQPLVNINAQNPYGNNKLFLSITGPSQANGLANPNAPMAVAVNPPAKKAITLACAHRVAPLFLTSKREARAPVKSAKAGVSDSKKASTFDSSVDKAILSSDIFAPKVDFRRLVVNGSKGGPPNTALLTYTEDAQKPDQVSFVLDKKEKEPAVEAPRVEYIAKATDEIDDDGYWTAPPLSELKKKSLAELRSVENFTVGRKYYGLLKFTKPVDLSNFSLDDICGNIVVFGAKNVVLYPDDDKPQEGEGLNLPAEATLEGCFPINKKTKLAILDPKDEVVKKHIDKLKSLPDMKFKNYEPTTGNWTFSFDHV